VCRFCFDPASCGHLIWVPNFLEGIASSLGSPVLFRSAAKCGSCYLCHLLLHYCHVPCAFPPLFLRFSPAFPTHSLPSAPFIFMSNFHELRLKELLPGCTWKFSSLCATWLLPVCQLPFCRFGFSTTVYHPFFSGWVVLWGENVKCEMKWNVIQCHVPCLFACWLRKLLLPVVAVPIGFNSLNAFWQIPKLTDTTLECSDKASRMFAIRWPTIPKIKLIVHKQK